MKLALALVLAVSGCSAQPAKTLVMFGARPGDAERLGGSAAKEYRARGYQVLYAEMGGPELNLHIDLTTATRRPQAQLAVSKFLQEHNPEITITYCMGEPSVVNHTVADLVYRSWENARGKGAHLGQLWFRVPDAKSGIISEPRFRRIFEPVRQGQYFVVADAGSLPPQPPEARPAPPPSYKPPSGRRP